MFKEITFKEFKENPFTLFLEDWGLVTAGNQEHFNTMTIAWGQLGILWNKPICTAYVRPTRYTYEFMEDNEYFTVTFFDKEYHEPLRILGTKSGRDGDKVQESGLTVEVLDNQIAFKEAKYVMILKKIYYHDIDKSRFLDQAIDKNYNNDYHRAYVGEVVKIYKNESTK